MNEVVNIMKERPILMSGAMVRALLAGTKTQTRRIVKPQPDSDKAIEIMHNGTSFAAYDLTDWLTDKYQGYGFQDEDQLWRCPYGQPGDRLWVRETWSVIDDGEHDFVIQYRADDYKMAWYDHALRYEHLWRDMDNRWRPSIHMPRAFSRLLLEIVSVRVERLQDISEADARAEGYGGYKDFYDLLSEEDQIGFGLMDEDWDDFAKRKGFTYPIEWYHMLWDKINGYGGWSANPWVWVVEFKHIDADGKEVARG